jgi:KUP system potassium uptake protein
MLTWRRGRRLVTKRRIEDEGSLAEFVAELREHPLPRVAGTSVFPHPDSQTVPLALRATARFHGVIHEHVVIVSSAEENVPHVPRPERLSVDSLDYSDDGIVHVTIRFGFQDDQDIPAALRDAVRLGGELDFDPDEAFYFLSRVSLERGSFTTLPAWQKRLFIGLAHNAASPATYFRLPVERTVVMGTQIEI